MDSGPDGATGTADDTTITTYNRTNAATQILINNDPTLVQTYKGVEITATKRMSNRWQVLAGLTLSRSRQDDLSEAISTANLTSGPNTLINTSGPIATDVPVQFKLTGTYLLPAAIALAANFRSQSGTPYNRQLSVPMSVGGSATINAEPFDSERLDALTTLDLQASRLFTIGNGRSFNVVFAVSNITNANTVWSVPDADRGVVVPRRRRPDWRDQHGAAVRDADQHPRSADRAPGRNVQVLRPVMH